MLYLVTLLLGVFSQVACLTPDQDKILHTSIMAIDATLKITCTSLDIAAMWKNKTDPVYDNLVNASRIIGAVDTNLVQEMTKITEETCGTCTQIVKGVEDILHDLENTLTAAVPEWKSNPIYNSVVMAVNMIVRIVPEFCPTASNITLRADVQCLTPDQDKKLKTSIMAIDATLEITVTSLQISAMWKNGTQKAQIEQAAKIISAVDTQLVQKMVPITEKTCGTCSQITAEVAEIVKDLENTLTASVPDWKTDPIYMSVTMALNAILGIVPAFCPAPARFMTHQC